MRKSTLLLGLLFITVGFAAVNTSLSINNSSNIANILEDFDVYYSDVLINGERDFKTVETEDTLKFIPKLSGNKYVLEYDVTNGSANYDANVTVTCVNDGTNEFVNTFDSSKPLEAHETRRGSVTLDAVSFAVGDELSINNEKFNVIEVGDDNVTLLAQYNVGANLVQSTTAKSLSFSSASGWVNDPGPQEIDIQTYSVAAKNYLNYYLDYLIDYTGDESITGDFITLSQLTQLGCTGIDSSYSYNLSGNCNNSPYVKWLVNGQTAWTKSAVANTVSRAVWEKPADNIWYMTTSGDIYHSIYNGTNGVRPVIKISKATIAKYNIDVSKITCTIQATPVENDVLGNGTLPEPVYPELDPEEYCSDLGYRYGMLNVQNYSMSDSEWGDISQAVYLCSNEYDFSEYVVGYDLEGNWVYEWMSNIQEQ